jgi:hypothetical protein
MKNWELTNATGLDTSEKYTPRALSLSFRDDGSIVVRKGSTIIVKNQSQALVKGGLTRSFTNDASKNIGMVQSAFASYMSEVREVYKDVRASYPGEDVKITNVKCTKVMKPLLEYKMSVIDSTPISDSKVVSKDPDTGLKPEAETGSLSDESDSYKLLSKEQGSKPKAPNQKPGVRSYSTKVSFSKNWSKSVVEYSLPQQQYICLPRVPSIIRLVRGSNGSFYFEGLESTNLLHSHRLREVLSSITGKIRELESINDKGYITSTKISDYPVLSGYLKSYVTNDSLSRLSVEGLAKLGDRGVLNILDESLTLREKRVLIM